MKNLILLFALIAISFSAHAQSDSGNNVMTPPDFHDNEEGKSQNRDLIVNPDPGKINNTDPVTGKQLQGKGNNDGFMIQNGKMMVVVNGKFEKMQTEMRLSNGTQVMTDGYYVPKGGSKVKLMEGQLLDMNGHLIPKK